MPTTGILADTAERFAADTRDHQMTVLRDDGLHRHLQFRRPDSGFYWFDLITWPGHLTVVGDFGDSYVFARVQDMFAFFRGNRINPTYWSEKLQSSRDAARRYSDDKVKAMVADAIGEYEREFYPERVIRYDQKMTAFKGLSSVERIGKQIPTAPTTPDELRATVAEYDAEGALGYESGARELLAELERAGAVSGTREWTLSDWDWSFLWACHAIRWGISVYDAARTDAETVTS